MKAILAILLCTSAIATSAQSATFTVKIPKIDQIATINASYVNLRKSPSATSPKLQCISGYGEIEIGYNLKPYDGLRPSPYYLEKGITVPVLKEQAGWCQILVSGISASQPWIMGKYCILKDFASLKPQKYVFKASDMDDTMPSMEVTAGRYKGLVFHVINDAMDSLTLSVGGYVDGVFYSNDYPCIFISDDTIRAMKCTTEDGILTIRYNPSMPTSGSDIMAIPDLSRLTDAQYASLINVLNTIKVSNTSMTFATPSSRYPHIWTFDCNTTYLPSTTLTIPSAK